MDVAWKHGAYRESDARSAQVVGHFAKTVSGGNTENSRYMDLKWLIKGVDKQPLQTMLLMERNPEFPVFDNILQFTICMKSYTQSETGYDISGIELVW